MSARLTAGSLAVLLTPCVSSLQIVEGLISLLAAMELAAEGEDEAIASNQAWRTWTLGVLQAFPAGPVCIAGTCCVSVAEASAAIC